MDIVLLVGRILFGWLFVQNGINHFTQRAGVVAYGRASGVPAPELAVPVSGVMLILGGLSMIFGAYPKIGALLLVLFLVAAAVIVHRYWGIADQMMAGNQKAHFWKNLALAGAAMIVAYFGTGPYSIAP